jgi:hypothetical protein
MPPSIEENNTGPVECMECCYVYIRNPKLFSVLYKHCFVKKDR